MALILMKKEYTNNSKIKRQRSSNKLKLGDNNLKETTQVRKKDDILFHDL